jgi:hypothetical protein
MAKRNNVGKDQATTSFFARLSPESDKGRPLLGTLQHCSFSKKNISNGPLHGLVHKNHTYKLSGNANQSQIYAENMSLQNKQNSKISKTSKLDIPRVVSPQSNHKPYDYGSQKYTALAPKITP